MVRDLTTRLAKQQTPKDRLRYLLEDWKLRLPMASAILSILYPNDFTVYDYRLCDQCKLPDIAGHSNFETLWLSDEKLRRRVREEGPPGLSCQEKDFYLQLSDRDKDRYLWGKSSYEQLRRDVERGFRKEEATAAGPSARGLG